MGVVLTPEDIASAQIALTTIMSIAEGIDDQADRALLLTTMTTAKLTMNKVSRDQASSDVHRELSVYRYTPE